MTAKLLIAALMALAIAIGFALPGPQGTAGKAKEQIPTVEIGRG